MMKKLKSCKKIKKIKKIKKNFGNVELEKTKNDDRILTKFLPKSVSKFFSKNNTQITKIVDVANNTKNTENTNNTGYKPLSEKIMYYLLGKIQGTKIGDWLILKITNSILENSETRASIAHLLVNGIKEKLTINKTN